MKQTVGRISGMGEAEYSMKRIGVVETCYPEKFGIPRQPGLVKSARGRVIFDPEFQNPDMIRGLEGFSHIWLVFIFHEAGEKPGRAMVRPPRLGGNERRGVFATRAPYRPNSIGLSVVELEQVNEDGSLSIKGVDLVDGTPLLDVKPYIPFCDSVPDARGGFVSGIPEQMPVVWECARPEEATALETIEESLSYDPRPAYQRGAEEREYGCTIAGHEVRWVVKAGGAIVLKCQQGQK